MTALLVRAAVVASVLGASSLALAAPTVLVSVDSYERNGTQFNVFATVSGEADPKEGRIKTFSTSADASYADSCERMLVLMMNRPGRFTLELRDPNGGGQVLCKLVRQ